MGIFPAKTNSGIEVMSINLLLANETDPVVWRGPIIAGTVKQFWSDVIWDDVDYMFVDMPPGTGDVPLTVFQSLPIDGIVIVASPQELVSMIVQKAVKMAKEYAPFVRKIEIEVENLDMVREAVEAGADIIMLDNMSHDTMKEALNIIDGRAEVEISGNITKENLEKLSGLSVDYVSSGALTHSAPIMDISLKNLHPIE
jgi:MinD-like ATPase involved in chromosome partitioning or flagellar assembly